MQDRMHGVDNMDTKGNSKEGTVEISKEEGLWWGGEDGFTRVEKIMVLDLRQSEMVVNSYLEFLEGRK